MAAIEPTTPGDPGQTSAATSSMSLSCDTEAIRTPGGIQPRGALLAVDERDLRILYASDNLEEYLGESARDGLGRRLDALSRDPIGETARALVAERGTARPQRLRLAAGPVVDVFAHRSSGHLIIELEAVEHGELSASFDGFQDDVLDTLSRFQQAGSIADLLETAVSRVSHLTGFDRVLAYRFEAGGHGVVESERMVEGLAPFLGLHYPASDIPPQARALYREQWIRIIPDAALSAVDLLGLSDEPPPTSLDLSAAVLRAVSPIHLQYLRNMGVQASMSISLIVGGELWGLIACHHYRSPRVVPYRIRAACEVVGMTASMAIGTKADLVVVKRRLALEHVAGSLIERVAQAPSVAEGLFDDPTLLLGVCDATGVALRIGDTLLRAGDCPSEAQIDRIQDALRIELESGIPYATDQLAIERPALAGTSEMASGVLALNLSPDARNAILWFRRELIGTVTWAGEPQKVEVATDGRSSLGPRKSFAEWSEIVRGRSAPWGPAEVAAVTTLRSSLQSSLLERAEQRALTIESTRRYDREHYIAQTLKERLEPAPLPDTPGLDVAALYLPAGEGYGVSGDFFELIPAGEGWFAVIGDVCGKGPQAAGLTALARHTIRAIILENPTVVPSRIMALLNAAFMDQAGGQFATAQIAKVALGSHGTVRLSLCSAGHPPALHRHGSQITSRSSGNPLVGARRRIAYNDTETVLAAGDAVVMYTDGVTEAGRPFDLFEQQRLSRAIIDAGRNSEAVVEAIELAVRSHQVGELKDDIAILCLQALDEQRSAPSVTRAIP